MIFNIGYFGVIDVNCDGTAADLSAMTAVISRDNNASLYSEIKIHGLEELHQLEFSVQHWKRRFRATNELAREILDNKHMKQSFKQNIPLEDLKAALKKIKTDLRSIYDLGLTVCCQNCLKTEDIYYLKD